MHVEHDAKIVEPGQKSISRNYFKTTQILTYRDLIVNWLKIGILLALMLVIPVIQHTINFQSKICHATNSRDKRGDYGKSPIRPTSRRLPADDDDDEAVTEYIGWEICDCIGQSNGRVNCDALQRVVWQQTAKSGEVKKSQTESAVDVDISGRLDM